MRKSCFWHCLPKVKLRWLEYRWRVYHDWFGERVFESLGNSSDSSRKQMFRDILTNVLLLSWKCILCVLIRIVSWGDSNSYTQYTTILKTIENTSLNYPHLPSDLELWWTLSGSNCPCLEQIWSQRCSRHWNSTIYNNGPIIAKTCLFKYTEIFTTKKWKFSNKNSDTFFHISAQNIDCGTR